MKILETTLPGVLRIVPQVHYDDRGYFLETYRRSRYEQAGIPTAFVQDSISHSIEGVLRGLHLQWPNAQGKLVCVLEGEVFDVVVDVRRGSPTYGQWAGHFLGGESKEQLWIPPGFAHGFAVTSEAATFSYKSTEQYDPGSELAIRWDDPDLGIEWPLHEPHLSEKDGAAPLLREIDPARLPVFDPVGASRKR